MHLLNYAPLFGDGPRRFTLRFLVFFFWFPHRFSDERALFGGCFMSFAPTVVAFRARGWKRGKLFSIWFRLPAAMQRSLCACVHIMHPRCRRVRYGSSTAFHVCSAVERF